MVSASGDEVPWGWLFGRARRREARARFQHGVAAEGKSPGKCGLLALPSAATLAWATAGVAAVPLARPGRPARSSRTACSGSAQVWWDVAEGGLPPPAVGLGPARLSSGWCLGGRLSRPPLRPRLAPYLEDPLNRREVGEHRQQHHNTNQHPGSHGWPEGAADDQPRD